MFRKAFSILELEERKDRRVVGQDCHGNGQVFTLHKLTDKVVLDH